MSKLDTHARSIQEALESFQKALRDAETDGYNIGYYVKSKTLHGNEVRSEIFMDFCGDDSVLIRVFKTHVEESWSG